MPKWIVIILVKENPKTSVWEVQAKSSRVLLGTIKWYGGFRKYAFFPEIDTVYEEDCMRDISDFIEAKTREHKNG